MAQASHIRPVLLIDDSHEDLFLFKRLLARAGVTYPIVTVDGGEEAMVFLRACVLPGAEALVPLVIFCDVRMPKADGLEVLEWVRGQSALKHVPMYMVSGGDVEQDRKRAHELGATGFLGKFPTPPLLRELVDKWESAKGAD